MNFGAPENLVLLWLAPGLALFFWWSLRRKRIWLRRFAADTMWKGLMVNPNRWARPVQAALAVLALFFLLTALSRPQWGTRLETFRRSGIDLMICLDTSMSMETRDVVPSRLEKARHTLMLLLERLKGDRAGLILFSGAALVNCPLTVDQNAVKMFLELAGTQSIPDPGTNLGEALRLAVQSFPAPRGRTRLLLLVTDGENLDGDPLHAARQAREAGILVYCLGVGTAGGEPIPLLDENGNVAGYKKDDSRNVVISRLDEALLGQIAETTGGKYFRSTPSEEEVDKIAADVAGMEKKELETKVYLTYLEKYQYPLAVAIGLILLEMLIPGGKREYPLAARWGIKRGR
jgi:Ca-activated chloride channel family protein